MADPVITVDKISKLYRLGIKEELPDTLAGTLFSWIKAPAKNLKMLRRLSRFHHNEDSQDVLWALREVSFKVERGEVVGIIGRNGAGKSTLLKILSRITEPTSGRAVVNGRAGSLLEVGTGFHPELTGRENIYMNGTILGMTKKEIDRKFSEIVDFSGIEKFLDTPVKRYSSGMSVRLAFSVAAHLDPDILIVDEVLAVGDVEFQAKCMGKMKSFSNANGKTIFFVSHNMGAVQNLCSRVIMLRGGEIVCDDTPEAGIRCFLGRINSETERNAFDNNPNRSGDGRVRFVSARVMDRNHMERREVVSGENATFEFDYVNNDGVKSADVFMTIFNSFGIAVAHINTLLKKRKHEISDKGCIRCTVERLPLPLGKYSVGVAMRDGLGICDHIPDALTFDVTVSVFFLDGQAPDMRNSAVLLDHTWGS